MSFWDLFKDRIYTIFTTPITLTGFTNKETRHAHAYKPADGPLADRFEANRQIVSGEDHPAA